MILGTMNDLPGYEVTEVIGEVFGAEAGEADAILAMARRPPLGAAGPCRATRRR